MEISLIISTYNKPEELGKVMNGLREQSCMPKEVFVADDGSGPETRRKIEAFSKLLPCRLDHVWQEDRGFRAARIRNKAITKTTGEYLILLDGDCIPHRHFVRDHLALATEGFFFQGKRILISKKRSPLFSCSDANSVLRLLKAFLYRDISNAHHLIRLPFFPALKSGSLDGIKSCNMGVFRKDMVAVNGFNQDFEGWGREDSELAVRLYRFGLSRKGHPFMAICFHLWHEGYDRTALQLNDQLLTKTVESNEYFCPNGLVQN